MDWISQKSYLIQNKKSCFFFKDLFKAVELSQNGEKSNIESEQSDTKMVSFEIEINKKEPILIVKIIHRIIILGIFIILFILSILLHES